MPAHRCFNYTGRKTLRADKDFKLVIHEQNGRASLTFELLTPLSEAPYNLPGDSRVIVEGYERSLLKRFSFGRLDNLIVPPDRSLDDFNIERVRFRIKIVAANSLGDARRGQILAHADRVCPTLTSGGKRSLLPVVFEDIGEAVWELRWDGDNEGPVLYLNNKLKFEKKAILKDPSVRGWLMPAVVQLILLRIGEEWCKGAIESPEDLQAIESEGYAPHWATLWLKLFQRITREAPPKTMDRFLDWAVTVNRKFCEMRGYLPAITKIFEDK